MPALYSDNADSLEAAVGNPEAETKVSEKDEEADGRGCKVAAAERGEGRMLGGR